MDCTGRRKEKRMMEGDPLRKIPMLQHQIAEFKKAVRKVKRFSTKPEDEWTFETCYANGNRLKDAAIENRQAAIKGLPFLGEGDAEDVMRMMLALRGVSSKKQMEAWQQGSLKVVPQRIRMQKMAAGWTKAMSSKENWIEADEERQVAKRQNLGAFEKEMPLTSITCPKCSSSQSPKGMRLLTKAGFSNILCRGCNAVTTSSIWKCRCRIPWIKCPRHEHVSTNVLKPNGRRIHKSRMGKGCDARGKDVPFPMIRIRKGKNEKPTLHAQHSRSHSQFYFNHDEIRTAVSKLSFKPGSRLAAKFPHLVQAAAPT